MLRYVVRCPEASRRLYGAVTGGPTEYLSCPCAGARERGREPAFFTEEEEVYIQEEEKEEDDCTRPRACILYCGGGGIYTGGGEGGGRLYAAESLHSLLRQRHWAESLHSLLRRRWFIYRRRRRRKRAPRHYVTSPSTQPVLDVFCLSLMLWQSVSSL
jgi:hypothetical protein